MRDYYDILGVDRGVTSDGFEKSYRKIAMKYHPDKNPNDSKAEKNLKKLQKLTLSFPTIRNVNNTINLDMLASIVVQVPAFKEGCLWKIL